MLHLRIYSVPELTDAVVALMGEHKVNEFAVFRGVGHSPATDFVSAEVVRESANDVIASLYELGIQDLGAIQLDMVDAWISRPDLSAQEQAPGQGDDAVVWAEVTHRAYEDSALTWTYVTFMVLATTIAMIAIVLDSRRLEHAVGVDGDAADRAILEQTACLAGRMVAQTRRDEPACKN